MLSESALRCPKSYLVSCDPPVESFYEAQADYAVWLYVQTWAADLLGSIWYTMEGPGWEYSGLLDSNQTNKLVYEALHFVSSKLDGAEFSKEIDKYPQLRAYEFTSKSRYIWILWAPDEQDHLIDLPAGTTTVYDKYGNVITPAGNQLSVNHPVLIDIIP